MAMRMGWAPCQQHPALAAAVLVVVKVVGSATPPARSHHCHPRRYLALRMMRVTTRAAAPTRRMCGVVPGASRALLLAPPGVRMQRSWLVPPSAQLRQLLHGRLDALPALARGGAWWLTLPTSRRNRKVNKVSAM